MASAAGQMAALRVYKANKKKEMKKKSNNVTDVRQNRHPFVACDVAVVRGGERARARSRFEPCGCPRTFRCGRAHAGRGRGARVDAVDDRSPRVMCFSGDALLGSLVFLRELAHLVLSCPHAS